MSFERFADEQKKKIADRHKFMRIGRTVAGGIADDRAAVGGSGDAI